MPRFPEIEGLRAWLAWTVVISHVFVVVNFQGYRAGEFAPLAGEYSVKVFILISGFVIAGLVLDRQEPWPRFIVRRAFRIFPAYWVALFAGAVTTQLALTGLARAQSGIDSDSYFYSSLQGQLISIANAPWAHWLLHLGLLQGVVPESVLPWSSVAFIGPAWSLSLEWQFYLLAPALVWALRSAKWAAWLVLFAFVSAVLFRWGAFGTYNGVSTLLGGLWLFVIGIASRLAFPTLKATALSVPAIVFGAIGVGVLARDLLPVSLWVAFVVLLSRSGQGDATIDRSFNRTASVMLASPLAVALGARSYSVYIIHMPILKLLLFLLPLQTMTQVQAIACLGPLSIVLILIASELLYRYVERPMIRAGSKLAMRSASRPREVQRVNTLPNTPAL